MTSHDAAHHNPIAEAKEVAGPNWHPRVLEPSPPAITDGEWFADDPVDGRGISDNALLLPQGVARGGQGDWSSWLLQNPEHGDWVASRWLGGDRSLGAMPVDLEATRLSLHRLGAYVMAPLRHQANGKFGLRWTRGGFGTPFFGNDRQVRVAGTTLIDQHAELVRTSEITTLAAAADFLTTAIDTDTAAEHDSPPVGDVHEMLKIDQTASHFLGGWYGMAFAALESVRADGESTNASRPQLWPGHFDPAIEVGDDDHRGSYGASPGDHSIAEPYLYVSVWWPDRLKLDAADPSWNAPSFTGSILRLSDFGPADPVDVAVKFFTTTRDRIEQ